MIAPTRRGLIGGAVASAAAPALARAERAAARHRRFAAKAKVVRRGRAIAVAPRSGRLVIAHDRLRTIVVIGDGRRRVVDVGGQPLEIATSPDGRIAAVTTAGWDEPGLAIVELRTAKLVKRLEAVAAPFGVSFTDDGQRIVVAGGEDRGEARVFDADRLRATGRAHIGDCPRSVVAAPGSGDAWIVLGGPDRVVLVDGRKGRVKRAIATPPLPDRLAVSPDGRRLLVSHGGRESKRVSLIEVKTGKVRRLEAGRLPSGVAFSRTGQGAVALGGAGRIVVIGLGGKRIRHEVGGSPRGLVVAGRRAWTVDALTGRVAKVRL